MTERDPIYLAAYQTACVMRNKDVSAHDRDAKIQRLLEDIAKETDSFKLFMTYFIEALKFTGEPETGI